MIAADPTVSLEVEDIQAPLLHPRPTRYAGSVIVARIDDRHDGRELLRRLIPFVPSAAGQTEPHLEAWATVGLSFQGLKALGVPEDSLASFPSEFQQGMAARGRAGRHWRERARALGAAAWKRGRSPGHLRAGSGPSASGHGACGSA